jgi:hypothetical protein
MPPAVGEELREAPVGAPLSLAIAKFDRVAGLGNTPNSNRDYVSVEDLNLVD